MLLTLFGPMEFHIKYDIFKSGRAIIYIDGSKVKISKIYYISFSEDLFCLGLMRHFICISTVCQSTCHGVSGPQRVNELSLIFPTQNMGLNARKPVFGISDHVRLKLVCSATETR